MFLSLLFAVIVSLATMPALYADNGGLYEGAPCGCSSTFDCSPGYFCSQLPAPWACYYADLSGYPTNMLYPYQTYCE